MNDDIIISLIYLFIYVRWPSVFPENPKCWNVLEERRLRRTIRIILLKSEWYKYDEGIICSYICYSFVDMGDALILFEKISVSFLRELTLSVQHFINAINYNKGLLWHNFFIIVFRDDYKFKSFQNSYFSVRTTITVFILFWIFSFVNIIRASVIYIFWNAKNYDCRKTKCRKIITFQCTYWTQNRHCPWSGKHHSRYPRISHDGQRDRWAISPVW